MNKPLYLLLLTIAVFLIFSSKSLSENIDEFNTDCNNFMKSYVHEGMVDYKSVKKHEQNLKTLIHFIGAAAVDEYEKDVRKAFYLNAYNLIVIHKILFYYPLNSPMDIPGFFDKEKNKIGGEQLTLNEIENTKIREVYKDPRIHFVLVCAAKGCPKLAPFAYTANQLDHQLDLQTRKALDDPGFIKKDGNTVYVSEIFKWYRNDFSGTDQGVLAYINQYRTKKLPNDAILDFYPYDWSLNQIKIE